MTGLRLALAAAGAMALVSFAGIGGASADDATAQPPPADQVVARLNGVDITSKDMALAAQAFGQSLGQMPPDKLNAALVDSIIDMRLMAQAAEAAGILDNPDSARLVDFARDRALRAEYLRVKLFAGIDDAAIQKRYEEEIAKFVPGDEVHAAHILVKTEDEAKAIIAQLDSGGDFAAIAKEKSIDTGSAVNGGDLGFFGKGMMVKPFEDAAFALDVNTYSKEPVQTQFGFHVIKVLEKRKEKPPTLDQVRDQIVNALRSEAFFAEVERLRKDAKIEVIPPPAPAPDATTPPASDATPPAGDTSAPPAQ